ncbi:hypothetical protein [Sulfoacidibacillus thermotolerans]|uniref:Spore coat protein n=1 Tax=Sulfoacidibacillus thermotolerans TaxID=1765684 RepID=A0A2U3DAL1_SULT2|nr:hypothetical protein [Sulfoacidibacillus thermotolerans]PWI58311.1 hypothetical protein BM613_03550 [Sulfoacidibacillus thermotolerans]
MQALTSKELAYINDMLGGEDLLQKVCVAAMTTANQSEVQQFLHHAVSEHQRRHSDLLRLLEQHESVAH